MKLEDWSISIDKKGNRHYLYGYSSEPEEFELSEDEVIISQEAWCASDYISIFSNICEDNNAHGMAHHIEYDLMSALEAADIDCSVSGSGTVIAKTFVMNYVEAAGWNR